MRIPSLVRWATFNALAAGEAEKQLALDVVDVLAALGEHVVGDFGEAAAYFSKTVVTAYSAVLLLARMAPSTCSTSGFVLKNADVKVHDGGDFLAIGGEELVALAGEVADDILDGVVKALGLGGDIGGGDLPAGDDQILGIKHDGGADGDSGRNSNSLFYFHRVNLPRICPQRGGRACRRRFGRRRPRRGF